MSLYHIDFSRELLTLVPRATAEKYCLVPIYVRPVRGQGDTLYVAMDDPMNEDALLACSSSAGLPTRAMIAAPSDIRKAIRLYYAGAQSIPSVPKALSSLPADSLEEVPSDPAAAPPPPPPARPAERSALGAFLAPVGAVKPGPAVVSHDPPLGALIEASPGPLSDAVAAASSQAAEAASVKAKSSGAASRSGAVALGAASPFPVGGQGPRVAGPGPRPPGSGQHAAVNLRTASPGSKEGELAAAWVGAAELPTFRPSGNEPAGVPEAAGSSWDVPPPASTPETSVSSRADDAPEVEAHEIELPRRPRGKQMSLTLLDGTTIPLGPLPRKKSRPAPSNEPTGADLAAAVRAAYRSGANAKGTIGEDPRWEKILAALMALLVRKHFITDTELIEELKKL